MLGEGRQELLQPVKPWFIALTIGLALMVNLLPLGQTAWRPDLLLLVLCFWTLNQPTYVGIGAGFICGVIMDVHSTMLLGMHALVYSLTAYGVLLVHLRLRQFQVSQQAVQMAGIFAAAHILLWLMRMAAGGTFPGWSVLLAPAIETLLWSPVSWLLLLPQRHTEADKTL